MTTKKFIPNDYKEQTEIHLEKGGCCGQCCLAVIQRIKVKDVFDRWRLHDLEWKGYTSVKQLREYLSKEGYKAKLISTKNKTDFKAPFYILRIQWLGSGKKQEKPFYGYDSWYEASANTHFIVKEGDNFFCNGSGWFNQIDSYLTTETKGIVTSMYEIYVGGENARDEKV